MGTKTSDKKGAGCFLSGASFAADGNVITSDLNFLRIINYRDPSQVSVGLIKVKPGTSVLQMLRVLKSSSPNDVRVLT
jgi:putative ABC transport system permease protein